MHKKFAGIVLGVTAAVAVGMLAGCSGCSSEAPEAEEGTIYQTSVESFWVGVGHAYMTFGYYAEPEETQEDDTTFYGYVFNINVDSGSGYSSWLAGNWELSEDESTLTLTAEWSDDDNSTKLADAESGVAKVYTASNGVFTIVADLPSASGIEFTLDLANDKVDASTDSGDNNNDDNNEEENNTEDDVTVMQTLAGTYGDMTAKIELNSDKTWALSISYYEGGGYTKTASGTWVMDGTTYIITLTVTGDSADVLSQDSYTLNIDYDTQQYSATIVCNIPQVGEVTFDFAPAETETSSAEVQSTLNAVSAGGQYAKIELLSVYTWALSIKYWDGGEYTPTASGTWAFDSAYNIVLTVTSDAAEVFSESSYTLSVDYTTFDYSATITCTIPQLGDLTFAFTTASSESEHYTVTYNLNYSGADVYTTAETSTYDAGDAGTKEYIKSAPETPEREGYKFAGWYTVANPVLTNGASETEYIFGTKLSSYNSAPSTITNDVMEITADTVLYARWVQVVEISTEEQLKTMADDLNGWYKLTADITLTGEWTPIGSYYANYEYYENSWWLYAFHGELDGNGHKITGLSITTLSAADDSVSATEGSKAGTSALFGAVVNGYVHDLTIDGANINVSYSAETHAYLSVLAAFVQGSDSTFTNCNITNSTIKANLTNIWYVSVAGLFGGHWGGYATNCNVTDLTITVTITSNTAAKTTEYAYIGGLVAEGYAHVVSCKADVDITCTIADSRSESVPELNMYFGGATASSTYLDKVSYEGKITLNYTKAAGKANVYWGGLSGYQRYGYIKNCSAKAEMIFANNNSQAVDGQTFVAGGILGAYDTMYGLMGTAYFAIDGCQVTNCLDMSTLTTSGTTVLAQTLDIIGYVPSDAVVDAYNQSFGVDMTDYKRTDGTYTFFGAFNCVKLGATATEADADGNVTVASESDLYGEAVKLVLGNEWLYTGGQIPAIKAE